MQQENNKKNIYLNTIDYIIITLFSCVFTYIIHKNLTTVATYNDLKDFYVGTSIYLNSNKYLDIWAFFIYLILFFTILFIYKKLKFLFLKDFSNSNQKIFLPKITPAFDFKTFLSTHKRSVFITEIFSSFLYVFLHPLNSHFYLPLAVLILVLIIFSIFHSYRNLYKKETPQISIFAIIPIFILLFGQSYNTGNNVGIDNHHSGEQIPLLYMHQQFNLQYYKDIMLVHGFVDIIPSFIGSIFFGKLTLYNALLGRSLFDNFIVILTSIFAYYVFKNCPIIMSFSLFRAFNLPQLYILSFLFLIKKSLLNNPFLWLILYVIFSFYALFFWTTYGTFWVLASLPLAIYLIFKLFQNKSYAKILCLLIFSIIFLFLNKNFIYDFSQQATNYIHGNIYNFGNFFAPIQLHQIFSNIIKLFALVITPYFIIKLIEELKQENKNINYIFTLIFSIVFVFASLNYSLGRIDNIAMQRIRDISMSYLGIIIPYLLMIKNNKFLKYFKYLAVIFFCIITIFALPNLTKWLPEKHLEVNNLSKNIGEIKFSAKYQQNLEEIKKVLDKYSENNSDFLDLNYGMNYFYFDKKIQIPYVSYYNIVNSKQDKLCAEILKNNPPKIILISSDFHKYFDEVYPSLKINSIYKTLLLSEKYSLLQTESNCFLIQNEHHKFSKNDLKVLDKIFAKSNLEYLPDAWGNSIKTLQIKNVEIPYQIKSSKNKIFVEFNKPQNGKNIDLIELKTSKANLDYRISINESNSNLYFKSKQNQILFPFDNFPSWLLNNKVKQIEISTNKPIEILDLKFYKRK